MTKEGLELLRSLHDLQNGSPLYKDTAEWEDVMKRTAAYLNKWENGGENILRLSGRLAMKASSVVASTPFTLSNNIRLLEDTLLDYNIAIEKLIKE